MLVCSSSVSGSAYVPVATGIRERLLSGSNGPVTVFSTMIESIICYNIGLWWSSMNENDKKALNRITKQAAKVT